MTRHLPFAAARVLLVTLVVAVLVLEGPIALGLTGGWLAFTSVAMADDSDDGGDDGDDGAASVGGGGLGGERGRRGVSTGGSAGNPFRSLRRAFRSGGRQTQRRARPRAVAAAPLPTNADRELVAFGLTQPQLDQLGTAGFTVVDTAEIALAGGTMARLRAPDGIDLTAARDQVRAVNAASSVDFNHFYRPEQAGEAVDVCDGPHCVAPTLIGWPPATAAGTTCRAAIRIGLIDTAINPDHKAFSGGALEVLALGGRDLPESGRQHGTAVAALLVGSAESRTPGLVPEATLVAADPFHKSGASDDRADAFSLVRAIDGVAASGVAVLNMSLSGPRNLVLERAVQAALAKDVAIVAAVGNDGPRAEPLFPAAYAGVIGVTAVDRRQRSSRRAGQGDHVDLAAPGVEVWPAASIDGARPKTGTSFAAPFVTAAAAVIAARNPGVRPAELERRLTGEAEDLGDPGRDPVFGWGLLDASGICEAATPVAARR